MLLIKQDNHTNQPALEVNKAEFIKNIIQLEKKVLANVFADFYLFNLRSQTVFGINTDLFCLCSMFVRPFLPLWAKMFC